MSFIEKIKSEMYKAMKSGEKVKTVTLRTLLAKLKDKQIAQGGDFAEKDGMAVIKMLVKQRKESIDLYEKANRSELAESEKKELTVLEAYLPQMLSDDEIKDLVTSVIEETSASGLGDIGKVMPVVMQRGAGKVDGKTANILLRDLLG
jgi:hypothetical protein